MMINTLNALKKSKLETAMFGADEMEPFKESMFQLYLKYYHVERAVFFNRFKTIDFYTLYFWNYQIVGFTGFRVKTFENEYGSFKTLYIGQTVLDKKHRKQSLIPKTCFRIILRELMKNPTETIYVWCDALTFKAYLNFARSVKKFYPARHLKPSEEIKTLITQLGQHYYGTLFDATSGTVRKPANIVKDPASAITAKALENPDIAFFAKQNPKYQEGHGLITLAPLDWENMVSLGKKCFLKPLMAVK